MLIAITTGLIIGMIAGITPGLHPNTLLPITLILSQGLNPLNQAILLVTILITSNYYEFIKSTYFNSPDPGTSLSVKYASQLVSQGRAKEAIKLLSTGALGTTMIIALLSPVIIKIIQPLNKVIEPYIAIILIGLSLHMILKEKIKINQALKIWLMAGLLGWLTLRTEIINQPLLPLLTGFYGMSNIIQNLQNNEKTMSQMNKVITDVSKKTTIKGVLKASLSSSIITFVPAIGPSQASTISNELVKTHNPKEKLITLGGVNTGDVLFSITALYTINKARSGLIQQISTSVINNHYMTLILTAVITSLINYYLVNKTANKASQLVNKVNQQKLNTCLIILITTTVTIINGWVGIIVLITSTLIGITCQEYNVNQNHLMAAIILPMIIYYI